MPFQLWLRVEWVRLLTNGKANALEPLQIQTQPLPLLHPVPVLQVILVGYLVL